MEAHRPPLVDMLWKLARDWAICKNRFERKHGKLDQSANKEPNTKVRKALELEAEKLDANRPQQGC